MLDKDELVIYWVLPNCQKEYKSQPLQYLSHLFGHEGKHSILSYLKKEGLALSLQAGCGHELDIQSDFHIRISLTQKGLFNYDEVA